MSHRQVVLQNLHNQQNSFRHFIRFLLDDDIISDNSEIADGLCIIEKTLLSVNRIHQNTSVVHNGPVVLEVAFVSYIKVKILLKFRD